GFALGGAGNRDNASRIPVLVTDQDESSISSAIVSSLTAEKALEVKPSTVDEAREAVRKGKATVAVVIPKDFGADPGRAFFQAATKPEISLLYDPSHAAERGMVAGILTGDVMQAVSKEMFSGAAGRQFAEETLAQLRRSRYLQPQDKQALEDMLRGVV